MKYSSVVSCRDGILLKRHWFDKPNKRWWGLIINGSIDDSVWWPWAPSYWMGSLWIMNEEIPDWSVRLSLFQTLSWYFNGASSSGDNMPTTSQHQPSRRLVASLLPNQMKDKMWIDEFTHDGGGEKKGFWTYKWEENYVKTLSVKVQDNRNTAYKKNSEKTLRSLVSLSLRTKCLDCLSGTQGCTYINTHTPKHRHKNTHTQVTAVAGCAAFCHLPGFPTPVLNVNSFILLYLEEVGEWWGEQKHQTTKKVPNNAAIFAASTAAVSFSSPSSSSLSLPLCPPFHIHTPA